jgi:ankyrin repeat protein
MHFAEIFSEEAIAAFPPALPVLDDSQISPAIAAAAAVLQNDCSKAASSARDVIRGLRNAWLSWHNFPTKHSGQTLTRRNAVPRVLLNFFAQQFPLRIIPSIPYSTLVPPSLASHLVVTASSSPGEHPAPADSVAELQAQVLSLKAQVRELQSRISGSCSPPEAQPAAETQTGDIPAETQSEHHRPLMHFLHSVSIAPILGAAIFQKAAAVFASDNSLRSFASLDAQLLKSIVEAAVPGLLQELCQQTQKLLRAYEAMDTSARSQADSAASKFSSTTLVVGSVQDFHRGLLGRLGQGPSLDFERAMKLEHCQRSDSNDAFNTSNYNLCTTPALEWSYAVDGQQPPHEQLSHGRVIRPIEELMQLDVVKRAKLQRVEVISMSLYTGPMFMKYNPCLRQGKADGRNMFATTIFVLVSAVQKIARVTEISEKLVLYCGLGNVRDLPESFMRPDATGSKGWTEFGFRSTTADKSVALDYSGIKKGNPHPMVISFTPNAVDRGACIAELSQYPGEKEYLFVPCSFLQPNGAPALEVVKEGIVNVVPVHLSLNLKTETIEEIVSKKRDIHFASFGSLLEELATDLKDMKDAGCLYDNSLRSYERQHKQWQPYTVDLMLGNIMAQCKEVYDKQASEDNSAFVDDFRFRNLVTEMLDVKLMAKSKLQVWMQDSLYYSCDCYAHDLRSCHRRWLSLLRNRITASAGDSVECRKHAIKYLLTKGLLSVGDPSQPVKGELPITAAACEGWPEQDIDALYAAGGSLSSGLPVYWASFFGNSQALAAFLQRGGNANEQRTYTLKYLDEEQLCDECPMHVAAQTEEPDSLKILAQHGANVNQIDNYGRDALFYAVQYKNLGAVRVLLDLGANPWNETTTRLAFLLAVSEGPLEVLSLFLDRCNINDDQKKMALNAALERAVSKGHSDALSLLLDRCNINDQQKGTALWASANNGKAHCVQLLLAARANGNARRKMREENDFTTPLEIALQRGHSSCVELLQKEAQAQQAP